MTGLRQAGAVAARLARHTPSVAQGNLAGGLGGVFFGVCFFARDLQAWVQGWQLGYWMAAQGAVLMFMLIALVYCVVMDYFERKA